MNKIPKLTTQQLIKFFGQDVLSKGNDYYADGAIVKPRVRDNALYASCRGSYMYKLFCSFANGEIADHECNCPAFSSWGPCKHLAALLIAWKNKSHSFEEQLPIKLLLATVKKEELTIILERLCVKNADFYQILHNGIRGIEEEESEDEDEEDYYDEGE